MYASLCPNCVTKKTTLVQQKYYQMFLSIATPMTKLLSITTLCILYFFCVRRIFSRLYVQYDYMPFYYHHCVKISYLCQAIISYSLHFKFCGSGEKPTGEEKLYSIYLRICLFLPNSCNISISFSSGGASKTLSLFAPRSHLVLYRNRRNVRWM